LQSPERGETVCERRSCTPLLLSYPQYIPIEVSTNTTTAAPGVPGGEIPSLWKRIFGTDVKFELDGAMFVIWLIVIIPMCLGIFTICFWDKIKRNLDAIEIEGAASLEDPKNRMEREGDKLGSFNIVRRPRVDVPDKKQSLARIIVPELAEKRPLGLELQELQVVRVHPFGEKCGWKEGDLILEIAGIEVKSFEELWDRIQIERDRAPITFIVERRGGHNVDAEAIRAVNEDAGKTKEAEKEKQEAVRKLPSQTSKVFAESRDARYVDAGIDPKQVAAALRNTASVPGSITAPDEHGSSQVEMGDSWNWEEDHDDGERMNAGPSTVLAGWDDWDADVEGQQDYSEYSYEASEVAAPVVKKPPAWAARLAKEPRIEDAFAKVVDLKSMLNKTKYDRTEVRYSRDAWGRHKVNVDVLHGDGTKN